MPSNLKFSCAVAFCLALAACSEPPPPPPSGPTVNSAAANEAIALFDQARADGRGQLARAYAQDILSKYPGTEAAAKVQAAMAEIEALAAADRERTRLANLWVYHQVGEVKGTTYTAFMYETDSTKLPREERPQLVLRRHPEWGQNVYILLPGGQIACGARCNINLKIDDANPVRFEASQPEGAPVPAMFIEEDRRFFDTLKTARWVEIEVPVRGGKRALRYEVAGIDLEKMGPEVRARRQRG